MCVCLWLRAPTLTLWLLDCFVGPAVGRLLCCFLVFCCWLFVGCWRRLFWLGAAGARRLGGLLILFKYQETLTSRTALQSCNGAAGQRHIILITVAS